MSEVVSLWSVCDASSVLFWLLVFGVVHFLLGAMPDDPHPLELFAMCGWHRRVDKSAVFDRDRTSAE